MKKLLVFILLVILFCGINLNFTKKIDLKSIFAGASVEVYLNSGEFTDEFESIKNGDGQILNCVVDDLDNVLASYSVSGYTLKIEGMDVIDVLNMAKLEYFKDGEYYYGFCEGMAKPIITHNEFVNFQCVQNGCNVLLGFPILLGSY